MKRRKKKIMRKRHTISRNKDTQKFERAYVRKTNFFTSKKMSIFYSSTKDRLHYTYIVCVGLFLNLITLRALKKESKNCIYNLVNYALIYGFMDAHETVKVFWVVQSSHLFKYENIEYI